MYLNGIFAWVLGQKKKKGTNYNLVISGNFSKYTIILVFRREPYSVRFGNIV